MNPGDKVKILRGIYKGAVGTLEQYHKPTTYSTNIAVVLWDGFKILIDPWDIALVEEEEQEPNEIDTTTAGNMRESHS